MANAFRTLDQALQIRVHQPRVSTGWDVAGEGEAARLPVNRKDGANDAGLIA